MKRTILSLLSLFIFLTACQKIDSHPKRTQVFRLNFPYDANTLDPRKNSDYVGSTVHFMLFEGLTRMTPKSTHELALADSIDLSADKKTYTFHLRKAYWSDGVPVTAHDFVYAWKTLLDPAFPSPNAHLFYPIKNAEKIKKRLLPVDDLGVQALNDTTLEVTLEVQTPYFLDLTSFCTFSPIPSHIAKENPKWADLPGPSYVTNGPFLLKSWIPCSKYLFVKNKTYWDSKNVSLDQIDVAILNSELTALGLFENDEIDFYGGYNSIPSDWVPKLQKEKKLITQPLGASTFLTFNVNHPIFQNKNIRKALSLAVHRKSLVDNITQCNEEVAIGSIPSLLKAPGAKIFLQDNDIYHAKTHLERGLKELNLTPKDLDGLVLSYSTNTNYKRLAQAIQQQWKESLGISIKLEETDFKILMDKLNRRDYQIGLSIWIVQYNDQMNILDRFKSRSNAKNYPGWENEKYIQLLDQSALATSAEERLAILEEAEELITEETPFTPLYHWNCVYLKKARVHGLYISPVGSIHLNHVFIDDEAS